MKAINKTLIFANLVGFVAMVFVNFLANSLPLNGNTTGALSDQYPNLFTPAGITFSIWGVIYLWLLCWVLYLAYALFHAKTADRAAGLLNKTGWLFAYSCLLNIAWLFAWHWEQLLVSVVIMANFLYILMQLNQAAGVGRSADNPTEKWLVHLPFGIYQGWISIALIANITTFLVGSGWSGAGISEQYWAFALLVIGSLLAIFMLLKRNNIGHGLAVSWALFGIYLKRIDAGDSNTMVAWVAVSCMVAVLFFLGLRLKAWLLY